MKKIKLGKSNISVSELGFGVLTMGKSQLNLSVKEGADLISYAIEKGINFFDTAQYYETYPYLKDAIKNKDVVVCSKSLDHGYYQMKYAVKEALTELDRNYIDIFLMHELRPNEDRSSAWEYLLEAKKEGLIKAIGVSTHHVDMVHSALNLKDIDVIFPLINIEGLGIRKADSFGTKEEMEDAIKKAHTKNIGIFLMKIFGGGNLTSNYYKALDYGRNVSGENSIMIGFGKKEEIDQAVDYFNDVLPIGFQPDVSMKTVHIEPGNCEGCGACILRCPNNAISFNTDGFATIDKELCLTCGYCAPVCPTRAIIMY